MGLCLSKRDVLIQKPQLSLREQMMLNSDLQFRTHNLFIPDSPSASMVSGDTSSSMAAEKHLLKNNSIGSSCTLLRSSVSNVAECGSRSSFGDWRFGNRGPPIPPSDDELDELSSTCPRTSGFSYLSSPMIEGIESYGLDNITRSYHKAKERFELDGFSNFNTTKLLEIDEEREDEETGEESPGVRKRKSHTKSLHVFGDIGVRLVPDIKPNVCNNTQSKMRSSEIGVFGAGDQLGLRSKASQPVFKQSQLDSDFSCSEVESEAMHVRSARWGFVLDSSGTDEMEGEETEASRVSSSSTQIESLCKSSPGRGYSKFMAVPPRSEIWPPNFSHMNPAGNSRPGGATHHTNSSTNFSGFPSGVSSAQGFVLKPISLDSSSSLSSEESQRTLKQVHLNLNSNSNSNLNGAKLLSSEDGNESDTSDDLFEIDNLGAALGSLSSAASGAKGFAYPMNSAFLQDPDISHSTVRVAPGPGRGFPFQAHHKASSLSSGGKILGPTLRANVLASASSKIHKPGEQPRKVRQMKKKTSTAVENGMFYGR